MSSSEITKDIVIALIGQHHVSFFATDEYAVHVAEAYEIIFNKVDSLNK